MTSFVHDMPRNMSKEDQDLYIKNLSHAKSYLEDAKSKEENYPLRQCKDITVEIIELYERMIELGSQLRCEKDIEEIRTMEDKMVEMYDMRDRFEEEYCEQELDDEQAKKTGYALEDRNIVNCDRSKLREKVAECVYMHARSHALIVRDKYELVKSWKTFPNGNADDAIMLYHLHLNLMLHDLYFFEAEVVARGRKCPLQAPPGGFQIYQIGFVMDNLKAVILHRIDTLKKSVQHSLNMLQFWNTVDLNDDHQLICLANLFSRGTIHAIDNFERKAASPWQNLRKNSCININGEEEGDETTILASHVVFLARILELVKTNDVQDSTEEDASMTMFTVILTKMKNKNKRIMNKLVGFRNSLDEELKKESADDKSIVSNETVSKSLTPVEMAQSVEEIVEVPEDVFGLTTAAELSEFANSFYSSSLMEKYVDVPETNQHEWEVAKNTYKGKLNMEKVREAIELMSVTGKPIGKVPSSSASSSKVGSLAASVLPVRKTKVKKIAKKQKPVQKKVADFTDEEYACLVKAIDDDVSNANKKMKEDYDWIVSAYREKSSELPLELATKLAHKFIEKRIKSIQLEIDQHLKTQESDGREDSEEEDENDLSSCKPENRYSGYLALASSKESLAENVIWELCMLNSEHKEVSFDTLEAIFIKCFGFEN